MFDLWLKKNYCRPVCKRTICFTLFSRSLVDIIQLHSQSICLRFAHAHLPEVCASNFLRMPDRKEENSLTRDQIIANNII